jgi:glycosyltransferase involved in cell wall biosynthesis
MKVLHVITGLDTGGAEMMLYKLLRGLAGTPGFECEVVSLRGQGAMVGRIEGLGVKVHRLEMGEPLLVPLRITQLAAIVRRFRPDIIQGWMYHGNLFGTLARAISFSRARVLWNVRQSLYSLDREKPLTALTIRLGAWLSATPSLVLYNSKVSSEQHSSIGYDPARAILVPNGFDIRAFRPLDARERAEARAALGLPGEALLIGIVGRNHPMKDHGTFLAAAGILARRRPEAVFVMIGKGLTPANAELEGLIRKAGLEGRVRLLGERSDIPIACGCLDAFALSSAYGEGFPNALGEAMACGLPCAATDVGDCAVILGDAGRIVPPRSPEALAEALESICALAPAERAALGRVGRARVEERFSMESIVSRYAKLYADAKAAA